MKYLVTGGTGYLGRHLVKDLCLRGKPVRILTRKTSPLVGLPAEVEIVNADLTKPDTLPEAIKGCSHIFHCAAQVKMWERNWRKLYNDMKAVNVEGTKNLFQAAMKFGVEKIVYTSSFFALGPSQQEPLDENAVHPKNHFHHPYEQSKFLGLKVAEKFLAQNLPIVIVFPTLIYGPGELTEGNHLARMIIAFLKGHFPGYLGRGRQIWSYAFINDVVEGHILAMEKASPGQRYILGGPNADMKKLFTLLSELSGYSPPFFHIPFILAKMLAWGNELFCQLFPFQPLLTRQVVNIYQHNWHYSSQKAVAELGYNYTALEKGLKTTIQWLQQRRPELFP